MLFNIAPSNAERVKKEFTATRPEHAHGYFKSVILTSENRFYTYRIDMICGYYILTVRTRDKEQLEIIATFEEYKPGSIAATKGELYKNGSGYPYRIEKSERYLKKYDQLACIVHGAIAAGLLFDMLEDEPTPATPAEVLPESNQDTTTGAQEGPTTAGTTAANETPTTAETAPQDATSEATTAETATERPETSTATQDTTGSDTKPPRATEDATTGHAANTSTPATAAGDTSTPANQEPGTAAGYSNKTQQDATTCDIMRQHATPGHACENAPERTERAQAEHVPTARTKSPPRAAPQAGRNTGRSSQDQRKVTFSAWMYKTGSDPPKI